jgi:hypothetical protein
MSQVWIHYFYNCQQNLNGISAQAVEPGVGNPSPERWKALRQDAILEFNGGEFCRRILLMKMEI